MTRWAVGDRVIAQIAADYKGAGIRIEFLKEALGGSIDGTLTEYQVFPDYVCCIYLINYCVTDLCVCCRVLSGSRTI